MQAFAELQLRTVGGHSPVSGPQLRDQDFDCLQCLFSCQGLDGKPVRRPDALVDFVGEVDGDGFKLIDGLLQNIYSN